MEFRFPKNERLKSKEKIASLFSEGKSLTKYPLKIFYLEEEGEAAFPKVAFSVPKRSFRKAVQRNRVKRLLREVYRLNKGRYFNNIEGNFAFLILYLGKEVPDFNGLEAKMHLLFEEFKKKAT